MCVIDILILGEWWQVSTHKRGHAIASTPGVVFHVEPLEAPPGWWFSSLGYDLIDQLPQRGT
jgi:hypothetical protein